MAIRLAASHPETFSNPQGLGIDPAPEMVELARRNAVRAGVRARFDVGVIEALPYPDDHFDVVLSSLVLHHLPDELKRRGLAEIRRVLKPGGRVVAVDFAATPSDGIGHLLSVLQLRTGRITPIACARCSVRRMTWRGGGSPTR
jgi:ubiquinone/menaquinone biosynthesis C-methylase UbiE